MKFNLLRPISIIGLMIISLSHQAFAGVDAYPQAVYECRIIAPESPSQTRKLLVKVRNKSKHIHIYGFQVDAKSLDCPAPEEAQTTDFRLDNCKAVAESTLGFGSMAQPPSKDVHIPPGKTRRFEFAFSYPATPENRGKSAEVCQTHSTATFAPEQAGKIIKPGPEKVQSPGFWESTSVKIKGLFN